jgi:triphosphoribosyl-dephospho-CoA synthetase
VGWEALLSDHESSAAARLIVKRYGDDAMHEAAERADQLLAEGDMAGAETWHRILNAIERLQAKAPAEGERVH